MLAPDYHFAVRRLRHHFIDAMTAHLDAVLDMPAFADPADQTRGAALRAATVGLHEVDAPDQDEDVPDLYFALQRELERDHGETVGLIRVGLSRNDLDMTVYKMHGRELLLTQARSLLGLRRSLLNRAEMHLETVIIANTHHQPGQPTTVAHYLAAVEAQVARDHERLVQALERLNRCPLGAAALAGTSHPLDRQRTASVLGFDGPVENTYDAVASADWELDLAAVASSIALGLGRFVVDLLGWASHGWYRLDDGLVQGSSIMPQKRNPVALEHARTRLSRVVGSAGLVAFSHHNIPFADLNDFGPDIQGALLVQHRQLMGALELVVACLEHGEFDEDGLKKAAALTDTTATELADVLAREAGLSFPAAHKLV
ncbi:MAG TPA: lyase family protein, partial [Trueperaceae bacterium]|nr:lyase family protein [Trueperaceae bacterium]